MLFTQVHQFIFCYICSVLTKRDRDGGRRIFLLTYLRVTWQHWVPLLAQYVFTKNKSLLLCGFYDPMLQLQQLPWQCLLNSPPSSGFHMNLAVMSVQSPFTQSFCLSLVFLQIKFLHKANIAPNHWIWFGSHPIWFVERIKFVKINVQYHSLYCHLEEHKTLCWCPCWTGGCWGCPIIRFR